MWCWSGGRGIIRKLSLCYSIAYHYNGAQWYKPFLQVGWLDRDLILLALACCLSCTTTSLIFVVLFIFMYFFCYVLYVFMCWAWWDWPMTWLTNHHPSVLWYCLLGHLIRKIVPKVTYNVNIKPYYTCLICHYYLRVLIVHFPLDDPDDACQVRGSDVSAADVVLYGLNIIVPLMNAELLKVIVRALLTVTWHVCILFCGTEQFRCLNQVWLLEII